jgi:hypothetical protein
MKKHLITLSLSLATTSLFAQGLVNFANTPTTLVSSQFHAVNPIGGPRGAWYFGLFLGQPNQS